MLPRSIVTIERDPRNSAFLDEEKKKQPEVRIQSKTSPSIGKKIGDVYKRQAFLSFRLSRGHLRYLTGSCALFGQRKQPSI